MKDTLCHNVIVYLLLITFGLNSCKKHSIDKLNISLHDKPLSFIQSHIKGNWKLHHESGGFCGSCVFFPNDSSFNLFISLTPEKIIARNAARTTVDTTIVWSNVNIFGDSTFIMNFHDKNGYPFILGAREIINDTLALYQPGPDGLYFYYTKTN